MAPVVLIPAALLAVAAGAVQAAPSEASFSAAALADPSCQPLPTAAPADPAMPGELILVLENALGRGPAIPLIVHLESRGGRWTEAWGEALRFNVVLHTVNILAAACDGDRLDLKLDVTLRDDFWVRGGKATYDLSVRRRPFSGPTNSSHPRLLTRAATHLVEGSFSGRLEREGKTVEVQGAVEGIRLPPRTAPPSFVPIVPDEHPRLLVRRADLPALRARIQTPLGKAVVEFLKGTEHEVADALLYALTQDESYARKAWDRVSTCLGGEKGRHTKGYGGTEAEHSADYVVGHQIAIAHAWDLCWDAWNQARREDLANWLIEMCRYDVYRPWTYSNTGTTGSIQSHGTLVFSGGGALALALWGVKVPPPPPPEANPFEARFKGDRPGWFPGPTPEERRRAWEIERDRWKAAGGMNLEVFDMARYAREALTCNINEKVGEGGTIDFPALLDYCIAYKNVFGTDPTGRPQMQHLAVEPLLRTVGWRERRGRGGEFVRNQPLGTRGNLGVGPSGLARYLVLSPPPIQAAVKSYWLKMVGLGWDDLKTDVGARQFIERSFEGGPRAIEVWAPFYAFQHFLGPPAPAPVQENIPRFWNDLTHGQYMLRGGTEDAPILVEADAATNPVSRWFGPLPSAGHFEVWGLGVLWTASGGGARVGQNVVQFPDVWTNTGGVGRLTHASADPAAGAAALTVNLDELYKLRAFEVSTRTEKVSNGWVTTMKPVEVKTVVNRDIGARATRAMAVDFSGRCGAPALVVVADRIAGTHPKTWLLNLPGLVPPSGGRPGPPSLSVEIGDGAFTLRQGGASLRATFITPAGVRIERVEGKAVRDSPGGREHKSNPTLLRYGIEATSPDPTGGDFLVIMTIQQGDPPAIAADGNALDATVTVGKRTIRFDGQKIILGDAP